MSPPYPPWNGEPRLPKELQPPDLAKRIARWLQIGYLISMPLVLVYGIGVFGIILCTFGLLVHFFFFRTQASLLELLITLIVASIPLGLAVRFYQENEHRLFHDQNFLIKYIGFGMLGFIPMLMLCAGSVWGFSAARRLREQRTWRRLGLMFLGWFLVFGMPLFLVLPIFTIAMGIEIWRGMEALSPWIILLLLLGWTVVSLAVLALLIERRCRALGGTEIL